MNSDGDTEVELDPTTAREALLAIYGQARDESNDRRAPEEVYEVIADLSKRGLDRTAMVNFEFSDQLAERLAKALKLLGEIRDGTEMAALSGDIDSVLALPPDIAAKIDLYTGRV